MKNKFYYTVGIYYINSDVRTETVNLNTGPMSKKTLISMARLLCDKLGEVKVLFIIIFLRKINTYRPFFLGYTEGEDIMLCQVDNHKRYNELTQKELLEIMRRELKQDIVEFSLKPNFTLTSFA